MLLLLLLLLLTDDAAAATKPSAWGTSPSTTTGGGGRGGVGGLGDSLAAWTASRPHLPKTPPGAALLWSTLSDSWSSLAPGARVADAWAGWRRKRLTSSPAALYRKLLEEQRDLLERQLRQAREELQLIRNQYQQLQRRSGGGLASSSLTADRIRAFKRQISEGEGQIRQLTELRQDLERLLQEEQSKVAALEATVHELRRASGELKQRYERELQQLRKDMEEQANRQLEALRALMENRMKEALEKARMAADKEREQVRIAAQRERDAAVKETERRIQLLADRQLQVERQNADEAVEREKVKMRKLIKALAEREKKLLSQAEHDKQPKTASKTSTAKSHVASNQPSQQNSPGTVRGPGK